MMFFILLCLLQIFLKRLYFFNGGGISKGKILMKTIGVQLSIHLTAVYIMYQYVLWQCHTSMSRNNFQYDFFIFLCQKKKKKKNSISPVTHSQNRSLLWPQSMWRLLPTSKLAGSSAVDPSWVFSNLIQFWYYLPGVQASRTSHWLAINWGFP